MLFRSRTGNAPFFNYLDRAQGFVASDYGLRTLAPAAGSLATDFVRAIRDDLVLRAKEAVAAGPPLSGIPVSEPQSVALASGAPWGSDATLRNQKLQEWGDAARASRDTSWPDLSWLPSALVALLLIGAAFRRRQRTRA